MDQFYKMKLIFAIVNIKQLKHTPHPHTEGIGNSKGWEVGVSKTKKNFKESMKLHCNFQMGRGRGCLRKSIPWREGGVLYLRSFTLSSGLSQWAYIQLPINLTIERPAEFHSNLAIDKTQTSDVTCLFYFLGGLHKNWRKRYFILKDNCLYYFKNIGVRKLAM